MKEEPTPGASIREAQKEDLPAYTRMLQRTYASAYVDPSIGLTEECFSPEVFNSRNKQDYLSSNLAPKDGKTWLAFAGRDLIGSMTIKDDGAACAIYGFYVAPEHQGKGVGRLLWQQALQAAAGREMTLGIWAHNRKGIDMWRQWGFAIDTEKGESVQHWPEWPQGVSAKMIFMRRPAEKI